MIWKKNVAITFRDSPWFSILFHANVIVFHSRSCSMKFLFCLLISVSTINLEEDRLRKHMTKPMFFVNGKLVRRGQRITGNYGMKELFLIQSMQTENQHYIGINHNLIIQVILCAINNSSLWKESNLYPNPNTFKNKALHPCAWCSMSTKRLTRFKMTL